MAVHSKVAQVLQIGVEGTEGIIVPANKQLPSLMADFNGEGNLNKYRPSGGKYTTVVIMGQEWTQAPISGPLTFGEIVYPLASIINFATPVTAASITTWTFTPNPSNPDTSKAYSFEWGDATSTFSVPGAFFNEVEIKIDRKAAEISGTIMARRMNAGVSITGSPTLVENVPVPPSGIDVYYGTSFADLNATPAQLDTAFSINWKLGGRFAPYWPLKSSLPSFGGRVEAVPDATFSMSVASDTASSDFTPPVTLAKMRAGSTIWIRVKCTGPTLGAGTYLITMDVALKVIKPYKFTDIDGALLGLAWDFEMVTDAAGKTYEIIVKNATLAL